MKTILLGSMIGIWATGTMAHSALDGTTPANKATVAKMPSEVLFALWISVLTPLKRLASSSETYSMVADLGHRFGVIASGRVPVLILMAGYMGYQLVGSFPALRIGDPTAADHLSKSISIEWLFILGVLGTTAVLTTNLTLPT